MGQHLATFITISKAQVAVRIVRVWALSFTERFELAIRLLLEILDQIATNLMGFERLLRQS